MLCLRGFQLCSHWVPLIMLNLPIPALPQLLFSMLLTALLLRHLLAITNILLKP